VYIDSVFEPLSAPFSPVWLRYVHVESHCVVGLRLARHAPHERIRIAQESPEFAPRKGNGHGASATCHHISELDAGCRQRIGAGDLNRITHDLDRAYRDAYSGSSHFETLAILPLGTVGHGRREASFPGQGWHRHMEVNRDDLTAAFDASGIQRLPIATLDHAFIVDLGVLLTEQTVAFAC
jgi:hypothetical protein